MVPSPATFPKLTNRNYQQWRLDMEARLRTLGAMRIVQGTESRPSFTPPLDSGERRELRDYDARVDSAAGEIWNCVEREQQTHLEAIRDDPEAMWRKLESVHMQKRPGTRFNTYNALLSLSKSEDESLSTLSTRASQLKSDMKALHPPSFDISKLDDELVLMALIRALPAEYNALRQTLLCCAQKPAWCALVHPCPFQRRLYALLHVLWSLRSLRGPVLCLSRCQHPGKGEGCSAHAVSTLLEGKAQGNRIRGLQGPGHRPGVCWCGHCECWLRFCPPIHLRSRFLALLACGR